MDVGWEYGCIRLMSWTNLIENPEVITTPGSGSHRQGLAIGLQFGSSVRAN